VFSQCTAEHDKHYSLKSAGVWADSIRTGETVTHNNYAELTDKQGLPEGHFEVTRHMSATVKVAGKPVAVLGVGNKHGAYTAEDRELLENLLDVGWPVVENRCAERHSRERLRKQLAESTDLHEVMFSLLHSIGRAVELRDRYTSRHQSNVAYVCDAIGLQLDLADDRRFGLRLGASIHDIGKIGVPADILNTPRKLTPAEYELIKTHPETGAAIFSTVKTPWPLQEMIRQHHERMDGSGYPNGLTRKDICLEARIIAVADTFDAISSHRPYRGAMGKDVAMEVLRKGRGNHFDPYAVDALEFVLGIDPLLSGTSMYRQ
jgi:HD-GYP domain-containing protein (c-di-GMP phosphodiesterase class II)